MAVVCLGVLAGCAPEQASRAEQTAPASLEEQLARGEEIYGQACALCHYGGEATPVAPALHGSPSLAGPAEKVMAIILHGQRGVSEVNGKKFGGIMPAQAYLTDEEVAAVAAYVRKEFGGVAEKIEGGRAAGVRATAQ
jgi:mono/diheme cytochrome c family protein